ncbi:hypothetical protein MCOR25_007378 [Pyricularia grisea]|nr:hypothetical protein MCOR25_007378 [Pyricularia grisea]
MKAYTSASLLLTVLAAAQETPRPKDQEVTTTLWFPSVTPTPSSLPAALYTFNPTEGATVSVGIKLKSRRDVTTTAKVDPAWHSVDLKYLGRMLAITAEGWDDTTTTLEDGSYTGWGAYYFTSATCTSKEGATTAICTGQLSHSTSWWEKTSGKATTLISSTETIMPYPTTPKISEITITATFGNVYPTGTYLTMTRPDTATPQITTTATTGNVAPTTSSSNAAPPRATGEMLVGAMAALAGGAAVFF